MSYPPPTQQPPPLPPSGPAPYVPPTPVKTSKKTWAAIVLAIAGLVGYLVVAAVIKDDKNKTPQREVELCQSLRDSSNDVLSPSDWLRLSGLGSGGQLRAYVTKNCPSMLPKVTS